MFPVSRNAFVAFHPLWLLSWQTGLIRRLGYVLQTNSDWGIIFSLRHHIENHYEMILLLPRWMIATWSILVIEYYILLFASPPLAVAPFFRLPLSIFSFSLFSSSSHFLFFPISYFFLLIPILFVLSLILLFSFHSLSPFDLLSCSYVISHVYYSVFLFRFLFIRLSCLDPFPTGPLLTVSTSPGLPPTVSPPPVSPPSVFISLFLLFHCLYDWLIGLLAIHPQVYRLWSRKFDTKKHSSIFSVIIVSPLSIKI